MQQAKLNVLRDPGDFIALTLSAAPNPDMPRYWSVVKSLRRGLRSAAKLRWRNRSKDEALTLTREWVHAEYSLTRLYVGGWLRSKAKIPDAVNGSHCVEAIWDFTLRRRER